jgi:hypothetical protein
MNRGSLDNETKTRRLFEAMLDRVDVWIDGYALAMAVRTNCLSTHVSALRHELGAKRDRYPYVVESEQRGDGWFYRLVRLPQRDAVRAEVSADPAGDGADPASAQSELFGGGSGDGFGRRMAEL